MKKHLLFLFLAAFALIGVACGSTEPFAASVNGNEIPRSALEDELQAIKANTAYVEQLQKQGTVLTPEGAFDQSFVARVLTRQVLLELVHNEVKKRKVEPTKAEIDEARKALAESFGNPEVFAAFPEEYQRTMARRELEVEKLGQALGGAQPVDDAAVKKFYDENPRLFAETCASHILFAVSGANGQLDAAATKADNAALTAQANQVRSQIESGSLTFEAAAAQFSKDPSKANGGSLDCSPAGTFVPPFEAAMDKLQPGQVSPVVTTDFGVHLIKVTDRRTQSLAAATPAIRQQLQGGSSDALDEFLQSSIASAKVEVNPRYGTFVKDGPTTGVVPPEAPTQSTEPARAP